MTFIYECVNSFPIFILIVFIKDRADSSGNEGNAGNTDPEVGANANNNNFDHQNAQNTTPPKDLPISSVAAAVATSSDKRKTIFRTSSNTPSSAKKKQSLSFTTTDTKISALENCLSPTNVEPRKSLLEQLSRTFATIDETVLPEVVSILGPSEPGNLFITRLMTLLSANIRPSIILFQAHNTAEIKAILQSLMNKIQK
jgi:hypothetical protein